MDENPQVVEPVEEQTAEVESPTTDTNETQVDEGTVEQAEPKTESPEPTDEVEEEDEEAVTEGMNEKQARAFQKMRQELKQLKGSKVEEAPKTESALGKFANIQPNSTIPAQQQAAFIQKSVGYQLDLAKTRMKYPELDPDSSDFNPELEQRVAEKWTFSQLNGTGLSMTKAAESIVSLTEKAVKRAVKKETAETAEEVKKAINLKEQSSAVVSSKSAGARTTAADQNALRQRTRLGDVNAFSERFKRATAK